MPNASASLAAHPLQDPCAVLVLDQGTPDHQSRSRQLLGEGGWHKSSRLQSKFWHGDQEKKKKLGSYKVIGTREKSTFVNIYMKLLKLDQGTRPCSPILSTRMDSSSAGSQANGLHLVCHLKSFSQEIPRDRTQALLHVIDHCTTALLPNDGSTPTSQSPGKLGGQPQASGKGLTSVKTSRAAPPHWPDCRARRSAPSSTMPPRAQLITWTPRRHRAKVASFSRPGEERGRKDGNVQLPLDFPPLCRVVFRVQFYGL